MDINMNKGHGSNTGGLQRHSVGAVYPYAIINKGKRAERFYAMDTRTGNEGAEHGTYLEAQQDIASLKIRNMMHS